MGQGESFHGCRNIGNDSVHGLSLCTIFWNAQGNLKRYAWDRLKSDMMF
jgi:hypothetical protein